MKKYRGQDRRMITKLRNVLVAIEKRDDLANNTDKKTTRLSTRSLILDMNESVGGLRAMANTLISWCNDRLGTTV